MKNIKIDIRENVIWLKLARPEKRNAFHPEMIAELASAFANAASAKERALVLLGEGESFCSGGDLTWMRSMANFSLEENLRDSEKLYAMYEAARQCPLPLIGRVHGHAMGGGVGLTAVCDIVAAESATQFSFSEVKWGLVPAVISSFVLEKIQPHRAREWMLTAKVFLAPEAAEAGLVHFHGTMDDVDAYVSQVLSLIKKGGPEAVRETKKLLRFAHGHSEKELRETAVRVISERRMGAEGQTGLRAFLERKQPPWA